MFCALLGQDFRLAFTGPLVLWSLLWLYLGNSQVSVYRTIGPTLVSSSKRKSVESSIM